MDLTRREKIKKIILKLKIIPEDKLEMIEVFIESLLFKKDDAILTKGIGQLIPQSKSFDFLMDEENLYNVNDLKEKY